ncbi:hypothetical protein [Xenorhabdus bovienii]|uniref:hypothetical protein n=1 Tax=Xenorhabdus bovienii TaxID=40576 RepID=UPI002157EB18|nr:hypothetical protein [Xenorhabdus bovienii]
MKELDALCKAISENRFKSIQKCIDLYYEDLVLSKDLYGWSAVTNFINQNTSLQIKESFLTNMFYRASKKSAINKTLKSKNTLIKEKSSIEEKKPSTEPLQKGDNVENKKSDSFKNFKNLNRISLNLIDKYDIDLETLKSLGVMTFQDRSIVESKIKNHCQSIDKENMQKEFSHILKKDS